MLHRWLTCFCLILFGLSAPAEAQDDPAEDGPAEAENLLIAVIEFVGTASDSQLRELTDEARLGVLDVTKRKALPPGWPKTYKVMTKESIATIARSMGVDLANCSDLECEVDVGRALQARYVVTGKVTKSGRRFKFMMKIFETRYAELLVGETIRAKDLTGLEAELRKFTRIQIAEALDLGGPQAATTTVAGPATTVAAPAPPPGAPARATASTTFGGSGDMKSAMDAKLKEKRCRNTAEQQGKILRAQRLTNAVTKLESDATAAFTNFVPTLETCVQLDFNERSECRDLVTNWLEKARNAQVQLPAGQELVETECGNRQEVFPEAQATAQIDTSAAQDWLGQLNSQGLNAETTADYDEARKDEFGLGRTQNLRSAAQRYARACNSGHAQACAAYAHMHLSGRGDTTASQSEAARWYGVGCESGDGESCRKLGERTSAGHGIRGIDARTWYNQALSINQASCGQNEGAGCHSLGTMYRLGQGVIKNSTLAVSQFRKACSANSGAGCRSLGYAYRSGQGTSRNQSSGLAYYKKACTLSDGAGCRNYAVQLEKSRSSSAATYYKKACDLGDGRGCAIIGYRMERGRGVRKDTRGAASYYKKACDLGDGMGCSNYALATKWGRGVSKSQMVATNYYKMACNLGYTKACSLR
jgi:TPR repeat protein